MDPSEEHITKHKGGDKAHIVARSIFQMQCSTSSNMATTVAKVQPPASVMQGCVVHHDPSTSVDGLAETLAFVEKSTGKLTPNPYSSQRPSPSAPWKGGCLVPTC